MTKKPMRSTCSLLCLLPAMLVNNASAEEPLVLEEVLVTAQKQTESLQQTPIAVNAISADTYNEMASFDLRDIDRLTAGIDISGDAFNIDFQVRGLGTNLDSGVPSRVTLYKDGAFVNQQRAIFLAQYDLERFELLRGPQGTLYGKASPAGSLVIHTRDPSLQNRDGYVQASVTQRNGVNTQFGISQPLIEDKLGLRLAGVFDRNSNQDITNPIQDEEQVSRTSSGRATLYWMPNDKWDARISYNYTENSSDFYEIVRVGNADEDDREALSDFENPYINIRDQHTIAEVNYALTDDIIITGVTMHQELYTQREYDSDGTPNTISTQNVASNIGKVWNSELRIASTENENWDWITGLYYSKSEAFTFAQTTFNQPGSQTTFQIFPENQTEDWGLFHHSGLQINDTDKLTIGIRYNDTRVMAISPFQSSTFLPFGAPPFLPPGSTVTNSGEGIDPANEKRADETITGTLKYQRDFNEDTTGYVSIDQGWRPGSAVVDASGNVPNELILHDDEDSTNFELGLKGKYWEGRANYTVSAYYQIYEQFQFQADGIPVDNDGDGTADASFNAVVNAEEVVTTGIEAETNVLLSPNLRVFASVSYNDTTFSDFEDAPCNRGGSVPPNSYNTCDFTDKRVGDAPNVSAITSGEYSGRIEDWNGEWYLRGLVKYESDRRAVSNGERLDAYTNIDLFTGFRTEDGKYDLSLWVKNLTDEDVIEGIEINVVGTEVVTMNNPRMAGITATWRFGQDD